MEEFGAARDYMDPQNLTATQIQEQRDIQDAINASLRMAEQENSPVEDIIEFLQNSDVNANSNKVVNYCSPKLTNATPNVMASEELNICFEDIPDTNLKPLKVVHRTPVFSSILHKNLQENRTLQDGAHQLSSYFKRVGELKRSIARRSFNFAPLGHPIVPQEEIQTVTNAYENQPQEEIYVTRGERQTKRKCEPPKVPKHTLIPILSNKNKATTTPQSSGKRVSNTSVPGLQHMATEDPPVTPPDILGDLALFEVQTETPTNSDFARETVPPLIPLKKGKKDKSQDDFNRINATPFPNNKPKPHKPTNIKEKERAQPKTKGPINNYVSQIFNYHGQNKEMNPQEYQPLPATAKIPCLLCQKLFLKGAVNAHAEKCEGVTTNVETRTSENIVQLTCSGCDQMFMETTKLN